MPCLRGEAGLQQPSEAEQGRDRAVNVHPGVPRSSPLRSGRSLFNACSLLHLNLFHVTAQKKENTAQHVLPGTAFQRCLPDRLPGAAASAAACGAVLFLLSVPRPVRVVRTRPSQPQSCSHRAAMPCQPKLLVKTGPRLSASYEPAEAYDATSTNSNLQHSTASNRV